MADNQPNDLAPTPADDVRRTLSHVALGAMLVARGEIPPRNKADRIARLIVSKAPAGHVLSLFYSSSSSSSRTQMQMGLRRSPLSTCIGPTVRWRITPRSTTV